MFVNFGKSIRFDLVYALRSRFFVPLRSTKTASLRSGCERFLVKNVKVFKFLNLENKIHEIQSFINVNSFVILKNNGS